LTGAAAVGGIAAWPPTHSDSELERRPTTSRRGPGYDPEAGERRRSGKRATSPVSDVSSETVELPPRFDRQGRSLYTDERHDSIGDAVEAFLTGKTNAGRSFNRAVDGFLSGIGGGSSDRDGRIGESSRRDRDRRY
jgi:hypothetical protein